MYTQTHHRLFSHLNYLQSYYIQNRTLQVCTWNHRSVRRTGSTTISLVFVVKLIHASRRQRHWFTACNTLGSTVFCFAITSTSCQTSAGRRRGRGTRDCRSTLPSGSRAGMEEQSLLLELHSRPCHLHRPIQTSVLHNTHTAEADQHACIQCRKFCHLLTLLPVKGSDVHMGLFLEHWKNFNQILCTLGNSVFNVLLHTEK